MTSEQLLGQEEPQIQLGQWVASGFHLGTPESWVIFLLAPPHLQCQALVGKVFVGFRKHLD